MRGLRKGIAAAVIAAGVLTAASPASAATVINAVAGGPFGVGGIGTVNGIAVNSANTYDFTFSLTGAVDSLEQLQAAIRGPVSEPIQFTLYSGSCTSTCSGAAIATSTNSVAPSIYVTGLAGGSYFLQIDKIAKNGELVSGSLDFSAVPELGSWALMLAGLGLAGAALRGRRGRVGAQAAG
jgi:hypothetical protein